MRSAAFALSVIASSLVPSTAHAQDVSRDIVLKRLPDQEVVETSGEGIVKAVPDQAFVTMTAEARAKTPRDAQQRNAQAMATVQQQLKAAGVPENAVRTVGLHLQPEYDYVDGKQRFREYVARNTIEVRVDDISNLGGVLDIAVGAGATQLSGVRFDVKKRDELEREALKLAVAEARARADAIAAAAGRNVDRIIRLSDQMRTVVPPPVPMYREAALADARVTTPVAPGELEIRSSVALTATMK
jgi:uncharacterized protein